VKNDAERVVDIRRKVDFTDRLSRCGERRRRAELGVPAGMFFVFSNRLGCAGSLVLSAILTLVLIVLLRACS
jgi:hypothetical protein